MSEPQVSAAPNQVSPQVPTAPKVTFLSLEHATRLLLSVVVPILVLAGLTTVFGLWSGASSVSSSSFGAQIVSSVAQATAPATIALAVAIVVLSGLFWIVDRRVRAEIARRPSYQTRLAYKLPVYGALLVSAGLLVFGAISLVSVLISSLVLIGTDVSIGSLYLNQFLPVLLGSALVGYTAWYHYKLVRGTDTGSIFALVASIVGVVLFFTIVITVAVTAHQSSSDSDRRDRDRSDVIDLLDNY